MVDAKLSLKSVVESYKFFKDVFVCKIKFESILILGVEILRKEHPNALKFYFYIFRPKLTEISKSQ